MLSIILTIALPLFSGTKNENKQSPKSAPQKVVDAGVLPAQPMLEQAGEVKEIELDEKRAKAVYRIRTAISIPAVVEFPETFVAPPACGDCSDASKPAQGSSALFALQAEPNGNYLVVKPRLYPGIQPDGSNILASDFVTTVTVRLQSLTVTLQIELTEDKKLADARVKFTTPNRGSESRFVSESIAKAKAALEGEFAARVEAGTGDQFLRSFLEPHECRSNNARNRDADMVVELKELCRFGKRIYVRFSVENRGRALFILGEVNAATGESKNYTAVDTRSLLSQPEVAFQQVSEGVASFEIEDASKQFELKLSEKGGRSRVVVLEGFGF